MSKLELITKEINNELEKIEIQKVLLSTTFKGLSIASMKTAMFEGMSRGFTFKDFLEKNVYAIPFKDNYSLITSIDYARKIGMRSGIVGVSAPTYEEKEGQIINCSVTVKRKVGEYVGEYTAMVYFSEYSTGYNLWKTKPRTMIAKVAEMHALRKACPEELSQAYVEEEMEKEITPVSLIDNNWKEEVEAITNMEDLKVYYISNKGRGKDFDKIVLAHKKFLEQIKKDENI
jgi:hypothetical protein